MQKQKVWNSNTSIATNNRVQDARKQKEVKQTEVNNDWDGSVVWVTGTCEQNVKERDKTEPMERNEEKEDLTAQMKDEYRERSSMKKKGNNT